MRLFSVLQACFLEPVDPRGKSHRRLHDLDSEVLVETKLHQSLSALHCILYVLETPCRLVAARPRGRILQDWGSNFLSSHGLRKSGARAALTCSGSTARCTGLGKALRLAC